LTENSKSPKKAVYEGWLDPGTPSRTILLQLLAVRIQPAQLRAAIEEAVVSWRGDVKTIDRWYDGKSPKAANAWCLGEGLRVMNFPGACGLAVLDWFDHRSDVAGILGCCDETMIRKHATLLLELVAKFEISSYFSPYDLLPADHEVLNGKADDWLLRLVADTGVFKQIRATFNCKEEAELLNARYDVRQLWMLPEDLSESIRRATAIWFSAESPSKRQEAVEKLPLLLAAAYKVGVTKRSPTLDKKTRDFTVSLLVSHWIWTISSQAIVLEGIGRRDSLVHP
jgi:hypothetical protein